MTKSEIRKIAKRFAIVFPDWQYYEAKLATMPKAKYKDLTQAIMNDIRHMWDNQEITWLVEYINTQLSDGLTAEINLQQIKSLVNQLLHLGVRINYGIFQILMTECPILEDIFGSILGYQASYDDTDINQLVNYIDYQKIFIFYCRYHGKWQGSTYDTDNVELGIRKPIENITINKEKLTLTEEQHLIKESQQGNREAQEELIKLHFSLVRAIVINYLGRGVDKDDLLQEGLLGLLLAIKHYDLEQNTRLATFAYRYIDAYIKNAIENVKSPFYLPKNLRTKCATYVNVKSILTLKMNQEPNINDIALYMNEPRQNINFYAQVTRPALGLENELVKDTAVSCEEVILDQALTEEINQILQLLPPKLSQLVVQNFGLNGQEALSCTQIGDQLGLKRQGINAKINLVLKTIKFCLVLAGYEINDWAIPSQDIPTYSELIYQNGSNIYYICKVLGIKPKEMINFINKPVNRYVYLAYQNDLISINNAIYFAFLAPDDVIPNLTNLVTKQISGKKFSKLVEQKVAQYLPDGAANDYTITLHKPENSVKMN